MTTIAYLANEFPCEVEPYVDDEIHEFRRHGVQVIAGSVRRPRGRPRDPEVLYLDRVRVLALLRAFLLMIVRWRTISDLIPEVWRAHEPPKRKLKALVHTWLGACYAMQLQKRGVNHIHVHHGYFGSWVAMVAAELLDVGYSLTLHGSDLLLHGAFLETKLKHCRFCITVSEYNRRIIIERFRTIDPAMVKVSRLGVDLLEALSGASREIDLASEPAFTLLAVGRLHAVKDHAFLIQACARLRELGLDFKCAIAGEGPERNRLLEAIRELGLEGRVELLGHVARLKIGALYRRADLVVLTSRSEGIPLVLMEAMARGRVVLAPAITGIPELVIPGETGFLYQPGVMADFVEKIIFLHRLIRGHDRKANKRIDWIRHAARVQILHNFNRSKNVAHFFDTFLQLIASH